MPTSKTPPKKTAEKKGSKLASFVKALTGGKAPAPAKAAASKGKVAAPAPKTSPKAAPAPKGKAAASAPIAPPAKGAKGKAAAAPAPAPAGKGKKGKSEAAAAQARASSVTASLAKVKGGGAPARSKHDDLGDSVCREVACESLSTTGGYCRMHYIKNWKKIKRKELILKEGKLNQYIEELVAKYPDKYIDAIRQDLATEKDFDKVIYDLDLDESVDDFEVEGESPEALIDTIKRDFDDEGEGGF